jgi:23S rRNA (uracil1939-C5)-methyltransferase
VSPGTVIDPIVAAPRSFGYRARATMHADRGVVGFHGRRSHALVAVDHCPALVPALDHALQLARALPLGDDATLRGTVVERTGEVHLAIVPGRGASPTLAGEAAALVGRAGIRGVLVGERVFGAATIDDGGIAVSAVGFRQANEAQNHRLRAHVRDVLAADGKRVLELHAGDGNFTRDLGGAARVLAVEDDAEAIARLSSSLPAVEAVRGRAADLVRRRGGEGWQRALLDPPRAGDRDAVRALAQHRVPHVVYVSCDPATLARDAQLLLHGGYAILRITPFDLMPHTDHVEVVLHALLQPSGSR